MEYIEYNLLDLIQGSLYPLPPNLTSYIFNQILSGL